MERGELENVEGQGRPENHLPLHMGDPGQRFPAGLRSFPKEKLPQFLADTIRKKAKNNEKNRQKAALYGDGSGHDGQSAVVRSGRRRDQ